MTKHGSIVYYLVAVVCGPFFLTAAYLIHGVHRGWMRMPEGAVFLLVYFFAILLSWLPFLIFALLLRWLATWLRLRKTWQWSAVGAVLILVLVAVLAPAGLMMELPEWPAESPWWRGFLILMTAGPYLLTMKPLWLPILPAVATAWVLRLVHHSFEASGASSGVSR